MRFWIDHWHGKLPLAQAVWINFIIVGLVGCIAELLLHQAIPLNSLNFSILVISYFIVFHILIFIWQSVGVLRSCDNNIRNYISSGWTRCAQFVVLLGFAATMIWGISLGQQLWILKTDNLLLANEQTNKPDYAFVQISKTTVVVNGVISPGITRQLKDHLKRNKGVDLIELNSKGGNIFEARGIAKLIQQNNLNTHVSSECLSSCTTIFIAGIKRTLAENAKLGFHQYRINSNKLFAPNVNTEKELKRDIAAFKKQGIDPVFLDKAFNVPHNEMWLPGRDELVRAGIIN